MSSFRHILHTIAMAYFATLGLTEKSIKSEITGYGFASSSNTLYTGAQGSEHSASYIDPGDCATNIAVYPIGTKIYVVGLQKYFSVQDSCADCSAQSHPHFDLWMGAPSYGDAAKLSACADAITVDAAVVLVDPDDGYDVDATPLMGRTGTCDGDVDFGRTRAVSGAVIGTLGGAAEAPTTLRTVVSAKESGFAGQGDCGWRGHCRGATCGSDDDCGDPFSCVEGVCR